MWTMLRGFDQQGASAFGQLLDEGRHPGLALHRTQAATVKQFDG